MGQKWDACIDCGCEKVKGQRKCPRCRSCALKEVQNRPGHKERLAAALKEAWCRPDVREKMTDTNREISNRPDVKEKRKAALKQNWSQPDFRSKMSVSLKEANNRPEVKTKISESLREVMNQPERRRQTSIRFGGDGDLERIDRARNGLAEYQASAVKAWSKSVKIRDKHVCQHCGEKNRKLLHAHHIKPKAMFPELGFEIDNGITLCKSCHMEEHRKMRRY